MPARARVLRHADLKLCNLFAIFTTTRNVCGLWCILLQPPHYMQTYEPCYNYISKKSKVVLLQLRTPKSKITALYNNNNPPREYKQNTPIPQPQPAISSYQSPPAYSSRQLQLSLSPYVCSWRMLLAPRLAKNKRDVLGIIASLPLPPPAGRARTDVATLGYLKLILEANP